MLLGAARRRCPQDAAVSRAEASAASAAGWAQTPPLGAPKLRGNELPLPCFQVLLDDERDWNETEAQTLKLFVCIVHSLVDVAKLRKVHLVI